LTGPGVIEVARANAAIEAMMLICVSFHVEDAQTIAAAARPVLKKITLPRPVRPAPAPRGG
jgi:hypothetical protein